MPSDEDLTPAQETMAAIAFLRAEYSVLGMDPDGMRTHYPRNRTLLLIGCAALSFLAGLIERRLRKGSELTAIPADAVLLPVLVGTLVFAAWGVVDLAENWVKPGALALAAVALTQHALTLLPAFLNRKAALRKAEGRRAVLCCVLPSVLSALGTVAAVLGACASAKGIVPVSAGLNRVLANTGGADAAAIRAAILPGCISILLGALAVWAAWILDRRQEVCLSGPLEAVLETLPGIAGMAAAILVSFMRRVWFGVLLLLALVVAVGLMAMAQNRRPERVGPMVRLPGQIACAAAAGIGANLAARSVIGLGGYLACVLCAVVFTRTAAKLLTRR